MLVIRFSRVGKRNHAQFKIVVAEKTAPIKGRFVEQLGSYDPHLKQTVIKEDRVKHWMDNGAQVTDSVWNLLVKEGVVKDKKRALTLTPKKSKEGEEKPREKDAKTDKADKTDKEEKSADASDTLKDTPLRPAKQDSEGQAEEDTVKDPGEKADEKPAKNKSDKETDKTDKKEEKK